MPGPNPKHNKPIDQTSPMGVKHEGMKCSVVGCSETGMHSLSIQNIEGYLSKLNLKLNEETSKTKKVILCKKHFKEYKKEKDKDEKYLKIKDFGNKKSERPPKPDKQML